MQQCAKSQKLYEWEEPIQFEKKPIKKESAKSRLKTSKKENTKLKQVMENSKTLIP